jgi:hypothetical protein
MVSLVVKARVLSGGELNFFSDKLNLKCHEFMKMDLLRISDVSVVKWRIGTGLWL